MFMTVTLLIMTVFDYYLYGIWNHLDTSQLNNPIMIIDCVSADFFEFAKLIKPLQLIMFSLICISANKDYMTFL